MILIEDQRLVSAQAVHLEVETAKKMVQVSKSLPESRVKYMLLDDANVRKELLQRLGLWED